MGVQEKTMEQCSNSQLIFSSVNYKVMEDARVARKNNSSPTFQAHLVLSTSSTEGTCRPSLLRNVNPQREQISTSSSLPPPP